MILPRGKVGHCRRFGLSKVNLWEPFFVEPAPRPPGAGRTGARRRARRPLYGWTSSTSTSLTRGIASSGSC